MEAIFSCYSTEKSISPYNYNRRISRFPENFGPSNQIHGGGILSAPPPTSPYSSFPLNHHRQPPLLPLPIPRTYSSSLPPIRNNTNTARNLSRSPPTPPTNKKINKSRSKGEQDLTPKKSKATKKQVLSPPAVVRVGKVKSEPTVVVIESNRFGPEPGDLPKEVGSRVLKPPPSFVTVVTEDEEEGEEEIVLKKEESICGGSIFSLAPPPSSLPLPRFSMKPKISCNLEAVGVDAGATDNLRRMLRLP